LRILVGRGRGLWLGVALHYLDGHVAVACEDEQAGRVGLVNFAVCALRFERCQPPCSDEAVLDAVICGAILVAGQRHCYHTDKQGHYAERKQFFHVPPLLLARLMVKPKSGASSCQRKARALARRSLAGLKPGPYTCFGCSAADDFLQFFGVAGALRRDLRGGGLDFSKVVGRQVD
jgi:hypothetical protein